MKKDRGAILITVILLISLLIAACAVLIRVTNTDNRIVKMELERKQAFYLAEAGIERAKTILSSNPDWFTDIPSSRHDEINWLMREAVGSTEILGNGAFKIIRENGKNIIFSLGFFEGAGKRTVVSLIKIEFKGNPFRALKWQLL